MHSKSAESVKTQRPAGNAQKSISQGCFALIWMRGISEHHESAVLRDVEEIAGVMSVTFSRKHPYILLASYNPNITSSAAIIRKVSSSEIQARIVGC